MVKDKFQRIHQRPREVLDGFAALETSAAEIFEGVAQFLLRGPAAKGGEVKLLDQRRDSTKLFTVVHFKNARLPGNDGFPALLKLADDVGGGLDIAR